MRNPKSKNPDNSDSFRFKKLEEYKSDYLNLLENYKKQSVDNDEINFIEEEIRLITEFIRPIIESQKTELEEMVGLDFGKVMIESNLSSYKKIKHFLETRKLELEPASISEPLDLSENSTAVEKIIYLYELGIIDFLKSKTEFISSTNLMATFLSAITSEKASTLQTSLNRLINNDTEDKNHPYRTIKTVEKVRQSLIDKNITPKTS
ncbi:hypothetical protein [Flavobacterium sp.]|jgi:hypothetical protein|uniref:hypothetical protein n=1 Tax=Flavobacterium sp. TaxID=239 RepID=UPI0037C0C0BE